MADKKRPDPFRHRNWHIKEKLELEGLRRQVSEQAQLITRLRRTVQQREHVIAVQDNLLLAEELMIRRLCPQPWANVPSVTLPVMTHQFGVPAAQVLPAVLPAREQPQQPQQDQQQQQQTQQPQMPHIPMPMTPSFMPPFMMPPPPPPPPFLQPPSFADMTHEQLRAMQGNSRSALETRMRTTQNISVLLDAAMYQTAVTAQMATAQSATPAQGEASGQNPTSSSSITDLGAASSTNISDGAASSSNV
ncbi:hypothetical protein QR680_006712 [Steinernema hermaphroditum]|uniref:Uncharacterized protein n=1 Tax=Steinernema hermaphroditum TaxID=289476 RepID=A0AA39LXU7_9BILA|nr:hypothetical protein QR680_006712 [Steinernema hermaphroditum]